nr:MULTISPECIES: acetolactate decarboxylase [unclassified Rathayibacter]
MMSAPCRVSSRWSICARKRRVVRASTGTKTTFVARTPDSPAETHASRTRVCETASLLQVLARASRVCSASSCAVSSSVRLRSRSASRARVSAFSAASWLRSRSVIVRWCSSEASFAACSAAAPAAVRRRRPTRTVMRRARSRAAATAQGTYSFMVPRQARTTDRAPRRLPIAPLGRRAAVRSLVPGPDVFVGVRLRARAETPILRRPIARAKPYRRLADAMRDQHEVRRTGVEGTLLGFVGPQPFQGISIAGLHTHVVDTTGGIGGHVLAASGVAGLIEIEQYSGITVRLPESDDHLRADLDAAADAEIRAVGTDHPR